MTKNRVGRRAYSDEEKAQIREKIIDSAQQLFSELDFNKVSMQKIADRAGMAKGNIYNYFKSINDLYIVMSTKIFKETYHYYKKNIGLKTSPKDKFIELYRSKFNFFKNKVEYLKITNFLYDNQYKFNYDKVLPTNLDKFVNVINSGHDMLTEILHEGIKSGSFRKDLNIPHINTEFPYTSRAMLNLTLLNSEDDTLEAQEKFYENYIINLLRIIE